MTQKYYLCQPVTKHSNHTWVWRWQTYKE